MFAARACCLQVAPQPAAVDVASDSDVDDMLRGDVKPVAPPSSIVQAPSRYVSGWGGVALDDDAGSMILGVSASPKKSHQSPKRQTSSLAIAMQRLYGGNMGAV